METVVQPDGHGPRCGLGRDGDPQERAAGGRGPGRRRGLRLRRAVRRPVARTDHPLRRPGDRRDRDAVAAVERHRERRRRPDRCGSPSRSTPPAPRAGGRGHQRGRAGRRHPRRGRHQLPDRRRPSQGHRLVRGEGDPHESGRRPSTPTRCATSATSSASASSPSCATTSRPWPTCSPTSCRSSTTATSGELTASQGRFGYASRHLQVEIDGRVVQVQLRTVLQHAWAEFEHDIRYKGSVPAEHASEFDRRFTLAAGLLELADQEFSAIRDRLRGAAPDRDRGRRPADRAAASWPRSWPGSTPTRAGRAPTTTPGSPGCCSSSASPRWRSSPSVLRATDEAAIGARMDYRYPPGAVRRLDDALLSAFGERYVAPARQRAPTRPAGHPARAASRSPDRDLDI